MKTAYDIIKRPIITEQSMEAAAAKNARIQEAITREYLG